METDPENDKVAGCNNPLPSGWGDGYSLDSSRNIVYNPDNNQDTYSNTDWGRKYTNVDDGRCLKEEYQSEECYDDMQAKSFYSYGSERNDCSHVTPHEESNWISNVEYSDGNRSSIVGSD